MSNPQKEGNHMEYNNQNNLPQPDTLMLGVLSLVATSVFPGVGTFLAIILGAIGNKRGKEFIKQGGELAGSSKVGYILCKISLISCIVVLILSILLVAYLYDTGDISF